MMDGQKHSAFGFEGTWKEYAPVAFTNLLLTLVTLGIYRFWATTRTRRYLWSRTRFIDDRLEWTGTGKELFVGFLMVLMILGLPFIALQFIAQALAIRGMAGIAGVLGLIAAALVFYFVGVARFRALRYRLSRTYWHGIRGGSEDAGFGYGWSYVWKTSAGIIPIYLLMPRAMMSLWNERWNLMSFGSNRFQSTGDWHHTFKRFLMIYAAVPLIFITALSFASSAGSILSGWQFLIVGIILAYLATPLLLLSYYAKFYRVAMASLSLSTLTFGFTASTWDWIKLILGDIALVICTLGIGTIFLSYRHWKFFITHLEAYGEVDLETLTQSATPVSRHGEGLLDALDAGAF